MPLYEYECTSCETRFDRITSVALADDQPCPTSDRHEVRRLLSVIAGATGLADAPAPTCGGGACGNC